jgi:hypothetical protein
MLGRLPMSNVTLQIRSSSCLRAGDEHYAGEVKYLFLDESGDHSLTRIDPQYPVFVLGGVIVDAAYAVGEMTDLVSEFKKSTLGRTDIALHTAEIVRCLGPFARLRDVGTRTRFFAALNDLMRRLDYTVVACAIRKDELLSVYGESAADPYMLSLSVLVERFCFEIGAAHPRGGRIIAERRGRVFDQQLGVTWTALTLHGTRYLRGSVIRERICGLDLRSKRASLAGLELADLVVSPIGRLVAGKPPRDDVRVVENKLRRREGGGYSGAGLVVLPKRQGRDPLRSSRPLSG